MTSDEIERRISRLESTNRRLRMTLSASLVMLGAIISIGASTTRPAAQIASTQPLLKDSTGRTRIEMVTSKSNGFETAALVFYTERGDEAGRLEVNREKMYLSFKERDIVRRANDMAVMIEKKPNAEAMKSQTDAILKRGMRMTSISSGSLVVLDETENGLQMQGLDGNGLLATGVTIDGTGGADTARVAGKLRIVNGAVEVTEAATQSMAVLGRNEIIDQRTGAKTELPAGSLTLFNTQGKILRQLP